MDTLTVEWDIDGQTRQFTVTAAQPVLIGRQSSCDIVLSRPEVSRQHARIFQDGPLFYIQNVSQKNPVHISDHVHLSEGQRASLQPGDVFTVGGVRFQVAEPPQPAHQPQTTPKIICSNCHRQVDFIPGGLCPYCQTPLSDAVTIIRL